MVLVGHSRAGLILSAVAERAPDRIDRLVYLCALLLESDESPMPYLADLSAHHPDPVVAHADGTMGIRPDAALAILFNATDHDSASRAVAQLGAEPMATASTRLRLTDPRFGAVPRAYIECTRDHAIPIQTQRAMQARLRCDPVLALETDHSPFLSAPEALAAHFIALVG